MGGRLERRESAMKNEGMTNANSRNRGASRRSETVTVRGTGKTASELWLRVICCANRRWSLAESSPRNLAYSSRKRRRYRSSGRSEEHTSELQSRLHLVCRLL